MLTAVARHQSGLRLPLLLGLCLLVVAPVGAVQPGELFPAVQGAVLGDSRSLASKDLRGKVVYVDAWASWCTPCRVGMPILQRWSERWAEQGFVVLGLNVDTRIQEAEVALQRAGVSYPSIRGLSDEVLTGLDIQTMPTGWLLGRDGRVRLVHSGFRKRDVAKLEQVIRQVLEEDK